MSETIKYGNEIRIEDFPPLYPIDAIVGDIAEKSDEQIASLRTIYTTFLEHDGLMPHARESAEKIVRLIDFEFHYRHDKAFADEVDAELESMLAE